MGEVKIMRLIFLFFLLSFVAASAQETFLVPDNDWRMWPDTAAEWKSDTIYLPGEYEIDSLTVFPPTGGWKVLNSDHGVSVNLPSTVEEHLWGKFGFRPYTQDNYWFGGEDDQVVNGNYLGVSWWWKNIKIPAGYKGKIVLLHIRAARLRAEVYINGKLAGYNIITETSFISDISRYIKPGEENLLAVRITNPGGRLDWADTKMFSWRDKTFHMGHAFGGLDRGITITAHNPVYVSDLWVANKKDIRSVIVHTFVNNKLQEDVLIHLKLDLLKKGEQKILKTVEKDFISAFGSNAELNTELSYPEARLWDPDHPELYTIRASLEYNSLADTATRDFGFRWFEADSVGNNAIFRLNGKRIRLVSAISWGFWGFNGLFPTPELAEKEVDAAKTFGMNAIQFHRNIGKEEVFDVMDRSGLLRYMEPGGGQTALGEKYNLYADSPTESIDVSGKNGGPETFAEKYMDIKILRMIRDFRSHPSLVIYNIQNEINPDLRNPRIFNLFRKMRNEDPSRIITLKSGIPPVNQVWMKPYDTTFYYDNGEGYSGWHDEHTVGGPGIWQDKMYSDPEHFTHRSQNKREIAAWGEMLGAAVPDNHTQMIEQIRKHGISYDLKDHLEIEEAYDNFLGKWNFRNAFPTAEILFRDIGDKCYDFWGRVIETAKLSDENDFLVISGWESTSIENHSGLLDNLRNFKGDPSLICSRFKSLDPVIRTGKLVYSERDTLRLDLFLINETNSPHSHILNLSVTSPAGAEIFQKKIKVPEYQKDKFSYLIEDSLAAVTLDREGYYIITAQLDGTGVSSAEKILVIDPAPEIRTQAKIAIRTGNSAYTDAFRNLFPSADIESYDPDKDYDILVASSRLMYGWRSIVDSTTEIEGTNRDELYLTESWGYSGNLEYLFTDLSPGKVKVTLGFSEITLSNEGDRVMNVAINGKNVLEDFDVFKTAGGKNVAIDTVFNVDAPDGVVKITVPKLTVNYAKFSSIKIEAGDTVIAINAGGLKPYTDTEGLKWELYSAPVNIDSSILEKVRDGMNLLAVPEGEDAILAYSKILGKAGVYRHIGHTGKTRASWMGSWFFNRQHPVLEGLPVNQAMKSYYQVPVRNTDGILLDGDNVDVFIGYGRDHDRNVGSAGFTVQYGKGKILFFTLPGMLSGLLDESSGIQPVVLRRLLSNSLHYLLKN